MRLCWGLFNRSVLSSRIKTDGLQGGVCRSASGGVARGKGQEHWPIGFANGESKFIIILWYRIGQHSTEAGARLPGFESLLSSLLLIFSVVTWGIIKSTLLGDCVD